MKSKIILLIVFAVQIVFSQTINQNEKTLIINSLDSSSYSIRLDATIKILENGISEALPKLKEKIFNQEQDIAVLFLEGIATFDSSNVDFFAHKLIDTINFLQRNKISTGSTNSHKIFATLLLFGRGDYSTASVVFDYIEEMRPNVAPTSLYLLDRILENAPDFENQAKDELKRILHFVNDDYSKSIAIQVLADKYGAEIIPDLVELFQDSINYPTKIIAIEELEKYNYTNLLTLLKDNFLNDTSIAKKLLNKILLEYNTPANYKFILDNYKNVLKVEEIQFYSNLFNSNSALPYLNFEFITEYQDNVTNLCDTLINYNWLGDLTFSNELKNILTTAKTNLQAGDSLACRVQVKAFQDLVDNVYKDSLNSDARFVTIEGWKFLYWNAQYILDRLPEPPANPNLVVNLKNSLGNQIPASNVTYYENSWKDAINNGDGTFTVITTRPTVSIRVYYEYASLQADNVTAQNNTYTFQTVNAAVQLKNSLGNLIDQGTVQYYAGAWRSFGTTSNGVAYKELLPINYSFRMTYEYGSIDKQQNLSVDPTVVFQTVNAAVQLKNSLGNLIDQGTVQYYAGAWRSFGTTSNGVAYKELLPINYSFRMTYEFVSKDKQQNLSTNPVVDFNTVLCSVKVSKTSDNQPINNATVKYYAGAWRNLGTTNSSGLATKELIPANISFRATVGSVSVDKLQDISVNSLVEILLNVP